jgi:hypothetical protein
VGSWLRGWIDKVLARDFPGDDHFEEVTVHGDPPRVEHGGGGPSPGVEVSPPEEEPEPRDRPEELNFAPEAPVTQPRCTGSQCFVTVPCRPGFASTTQIPPQVLYDPANLGGAPLQVMFSGPRRPPSGSRDVLQIVEIAPGATGHNLVPPPGTDTIFIGCNGSGSVTFRFSNAVA